MTAERQGRLAAEEFRHKHHLGVQPLGDLVTILEQEAEVDVAILEAGRDEHGLTMRDPERGAVFIAVAKTRHPMRQRSSLAHELAHVLFGDWAQKPVTDRSPEEIRADAFARHLLIPQEGLREVLGVPSAATIDRQVLSDVVVRFLVSPAMAAIALHQGGYIQASTKGEWMSLSSQQVASLFGWSDHYAALQDESDRTRAPRRLLARATKGYAEGVVSLETIASLRQLPAPVVIQDLEAAGVRPFDPAGPWSSPGDLPAVVVDLSELEDEVAGGAVE